MIIAKLDKVRDAVGSCCVYDIVLGDEVVYVGSSAVPLERFRQHVIHREWGGPIFCREHKWYRSRAQALKAEAARIKTLKPRFNRMFNPAKSRDAIPVDEAREIWFSNDELCNREVLARMRGWTFSRAYTQFGPRSPYARARHEENRRSMEEYKRSIGWVR